jgi:hypothetical protein
MSHWRLASFPHFYVAPTWNSLCPVPHSNTASQNPTSLSSCAFPGRAADIGPSSLPTHPRDLSLLRPCQVWLQLVQMRTLLGPLVLSPCSIH